jgi:hypothetical protein
LLEIFFHSVIIHEEERLKQAWHIWNRLKDRSFLRGGLDLISCKIKIDGVDYEMVAVFYTCLFHNLGGDECT